MEAIYQRQSINAGYVSFIQPNNSIVPLVRSKHSGSTHGKENNLQNQLALRLLSVNFVRPTNITEEYQQQLDTNITLASQYRKQFIFELFLTTTTTLHC